MATREQARAKLVPGMAKLMRSRDFRTALAKAAADETGRTHNFIMALEDDTMGYVFERLAACDGRAVVVAPSGDGFTYALMFPATEARVMVAMEDDTYSPIHETSTVGMFFAFLREMGTVVIERVGRTTARLIDDRELETV